jgi:outer membrane protein
MEALELSRQHSFLIQSTRADSLKAWFEFKAARALRFPEFSLNASAYYINNIPTVDFPFGQVMEIGSKENYQFDFRLSLPVYSGGKITESEKVRRANVRAAAAVLRVRELENAYACRKMYLTFMATEALLGSVQASLQRLDIIRENIGDLFDNGMADSLDILETELAYQKALQAVVEREKAREEASLALAKILGLSPGTDIDATEAVPIPPEPDSAGGRRVDEITRPELELSESNIAAARHLRGLQKAAYFPFVSTYLGYSAGKPNRDLINAEWNDNVTAGVSLTWGFNLGGKVVHDSRAATHAVFSAQLLKQDIERTLLSAANTALDDWRSSYRTFSISQKQYEIAGDQYRIGRKKQYQGQMTVNRLLELEAEMTAAEGLYRASMIDYYIAENEYLYAIGSRKLKEGL